MSQALFYTRIGCCTAQQTTTVLSLPQQCTYNRGTRCNNNNNAFKLWKVERVCELLLHLLPMPLAQFAISCVLFDRIHAK